MSQQMKPLPFGMVRLGLSTPEEKQEYEEQKIEFNKKTSRMTSAAAQNAKQDSCILCKKPCTSFCNSHSIPLFALRRISEQGKVVSPLQGEVPTLGDDLGVKKAGVFHIICNECDNTVFQLYENPSAYDTQPTDKMLAQIALKNLLQIICKRNEEIEFYKILGKEFPHGKSLADEKLAISAYDLKDFHEDLKYVKKALSAKFGKSYYLSYYKTLNYVVPFVAQASITMLSDFEDNIINNLYHFDSTYKMKELHVAVFPLEKQSVVLLFAEDGETRYRKFFRQLKKLPDEDQLAAINFIIFAYTENVFLHPNTHKLLQESNEFMDVCRLSTDYMVPLPLINVDPLAFAIPEFSLSRRNKIPNLLGRNYALDLQ